MTRPAPSTSEYRRGVARAAQAIRDRLLNAGFSLVDDDAAEALAIEAISAYEAEQQLHDDQGRFIEPDGWRK